MTREEATEFIAQSVKSDVDMAKVADAIKALEQEPTTKNDLGVDTDKLLETCEKMSFDFELFGRPTKALLLDAVKNIVNNLLKTTPQEPQSFKWCTDCKEYDQEKHCCHRYSKVIKDAVAEIEQEPVLDKLRAEIVELTKCPYGTECLGANCPSNTDCMICGDHVLEIVDKYKAEMEVDNGNNNH